MTISAYSRRCALIFLLIALVSIFAGLGITILIESLGSSYFHARLAYGLLAVVALLFVFWQVIRYGWIGLLTPLSMTMFGFIYFFCFIPILNPSLIPDLYSNPRRFLPLVGWIGIGMLSFVLGYSTIPKPNLRWLVRWLRSPLDLRQLARLTFLVIAVYLALAVIIALLEGVPLRALILESTYSRVKEFGFSPYEGASYYPYQIFRWLPIALAPLITLCLLEAKLSSFQRLSLFIGLLLTILFPLGSGVRYIFSYVVGGIACTLVLLPGKSGRLRKHRLGIAVTMLAIGFLLTTVQIATRSEVGLYSFLAGRVKFSLEDLLAIPASELAADQNYSLEGVLSALNNGWIKPLWGETFLLTFVLFVPRAIWSGKPGGHLAEALAPANPFYHENVSYSIIGEFAFNFTKWGVIFGMLLFGYFAGLWWYLFKKHRSDKRMVILYSMTVVPFLLIVRGSFNTMFGSLLYPALLVLLVLRMSTRNRSVIPLAKWRRR